MALLPTLSLFTLGAGATIAVQQYLKMKRELPDDTSHIRPGKKLQRMDVAEQLAEGKSPSEVEPGGTSPVKKAA